MKLRQHQIYGMCRRLGISAKARKLRDRAAFRLCF